MPVHIHKKGIRALGVSESFVKGVSERSILAGVVMRADMVLDGFSFSTAKVGGVDATKKIIELYKNLEKDDINLMLLNGCIISWYNIVDLHCLDKAIGLPLICVTYKDSEGLERYFKELFPQDWLSRVEVYHKNGPRTPMRLHTDHVIYARFLGMSQEEAISILNKFTLQGAVPEPLRIARLLARSLMRRRKTLSKPWI